MAIWKPWDSIWSVLLSTIISIAAFYLTGTIITRQINKDRLQKIIDEIPKIENQISGLAQAVLPSTKDENEKLAERKLLRYYIAKFRIKGSLDNDEPKNFEKLKNKLRIPENEESPAVILGMGGVYAIVNGLGITEALTKYAEAFGGNVQAFVGTIPDLLPYGLRLVTFLITIVPFIHGFILTFSNRWYYDVERNKTRYEWAFVFFMVVFFQTVLLFFAALNVHKFNIFIDMLWALMVFNAPWLYVQIKYILKKQINIVHVFPKQWIILNFITASFLSVFIFEPGLLATAQNNLWVNILFFFVLFSRTVADYKVGWNDLYIEHLTQKKNSMEVNSYFQNYKS